MTIILMTAAKTAVVLIKMLAVSLRQVLIDHSYVALKFSLQKYMEEVRLALSHLEWSLQH